MAVSGDPIGQGLQSGQHTPVLPLKVAALQFKPERGCLKENRVRLEALIRLAAGRGAKLVVTPEMATSGYVFATRADIFEFCEPRIGESFSLFSTLAKELDITLVYGWPEFEVSSGHLYNSAAVCFSDRQPIFYRKRLLFDADTTWATPGDTPYPVWHSDEGIKLTLGICMDLNDERFRAHLRASRARICAFPTNWLDQGVDVWSYWAACIRESQVCLVAANTYGVEDAVPFRGESAILDGDVLLGSAKRMGDEIVCATIG